jgi:esterase/lipase
MPGKTWQVSYGSVSISCKTEYDAKLLARELVKKGHNVSAGTLDGHNPQRSIESHRIHAWLQE